MLYQRQKELLYIIEVVGKIGKTKLQKLVFLSNLLSDKPSYSFFPYNYGPFSIVLQNDLNSLSDHGIITFDDDKYSTSNLNKVNIPQTKRTAIDSVISRYNEYGTNDLLKYVYTQYPYFATRSTKADDILLPKEMDIVNLSKPKDNEPTLFTIGYEQKSIDKYLNQILEKNIKLLIDVRANSFSMKKEFIGKLLASYCKLINVEYIHIPQLGIPTESRKKYPNKDILFSYYSKEILPKHQSYMEQIKRLMKTYQRVALTCFEAEYRDCHRNSLAEAIIFQENNRYHLEHII